MAYEIWNHKKLNLDVIFWNDHTYLWVKSNI